MIDQAANKSKAVTAKTNATDIDNVAEQSIEEMNLVKILSHGSDEEANHAGRAINNTIIEEQKDSAGDSGQVQGMALTVKEECIDLIIDICTSIRPSSFLQFSEHDSPMYCASAGELIIIPDESLLIGAID